MSSSTNGKAVPAIYVSEIIDCGSSSSSCNDDRRSHEPVTRRISNESQFSYKSDVEPNKPPLKRGPERGYDSDASWVSHITAQSEDQDLMHSETSLAGNRSDFRHVSKSKKKKTVHKLVKMKNMIKKTFSDVDATPDTEWRTDWKKLASEQLQTDQQTRSSTKIKRKLHKRVPFTSEVGYHRLRERAASLTENV